jgi:hypothetical protein
MCVAFNQWLAVVFREASEALRLIGALAKS